MSQWRQTCAAWNMKHGPGALPAAGRVVAALASALALAAGTLAATDDGGSEQNAIENG